MMVIVSFKVTHGHLVPIDSSCATVNDKLMSYRPISHRFRVSMIAAY